MSTLFRRHQDPVPATGDMVRIRMLSVLNSYLDHGITQVSIREMLDLLDPRYVPPSHAPQDPRADPMTGCMPTTADGLPPA